MRRNTIATLWYLFDYLIMSFGFFCYIVLLPKLTNYIIGNVRWFNDNFRILFDE